MKLNTLMSVAGISEKCPYLELFWTAFSRILTEYGLYGHFLCSGNVGNKPGNSFLELCKLLEKNFDSSCQTMYINCLMSELSNDLG